MSGTTGPRRKRRSASEIARLEAARRERAQQLERERENERRVDAALEPFAEAAAGIETVEVRREEKVAALDRQLDAKLAALDQAKAAKVAEFADLKDAVRAAAEVEISEWRVVMARSVREIRGADVTVSETARMLAIPVREVTALTRDSEPARPPAAHRPDAAESARSDIPAQESVADDGESRGHRAV